MSETRQLARNIASTLGTRVIVVLVALLSSVVLARVLGPEARGMFAVIMLLPSLAASVGLLGFEQANAVYAGLEPQGRRALAWQSAAVAGGVGALVAVAGALYVFAGAPGLPTMEKAPTLLVLLLLATIPARLVAEYWGAILRGMNRIALVNLFEVVGRVAVLAGFVVLVWWLGLGLTGAVWTDAVASVGMAAVAGALLWGVGSWGPPTWDAGLWTRTWRFALPVHTGSIAAYATYRVDEFIIAALLPPEQLGLYVIAVAMVERIWLLPGSIATVLLPHLTNSSSRDGAVSAAICRHVAIWTGVACLAVFVAADLIVTFLFSSSYAAAASPLRWLLPGIFTLSVGKVVVAELLAREKPRATMYASLVAVIVNIAGNLVLVPRMGISGAAVASSISYTVLSLILIRHYVRATGASWRVLVPRLGDLRVYRVAWRRPGGGGLPSREPKGAWR